MKQSIAILGLGFCILLSSSINGQELFTKDFNPKYALNFQLPVGRRICFTAIGRWDSDLRGAAGIEVSSIGARGVDHLSYNSGEYDLGKNIPGKPFASKTANFFAIIWNIDTSSVFNSVNTGARIGNSISNNSDKTQTIHFWMNDERGEYYNNSGWLRFIYFYEDVNANSGWSNDPEKTFKVESYIKGYMQPSGTIPGLKYEWVLDYYNEYSKKYVYTAYYYNTTSKDIKFEATYTCNRGVVEKMSHFLLAGEFVSCPLIFLKGMTMSISFKELPPQTVIPNKVKHLQKYNKLSMEAQQLHGAELLDKLYEMKALADMYLPEQSKEVDGWIAATNEEIKNGPLYGFNMSASDVANPVENCPPCPVGQKGHIKILEEGGIIFGRECECIVDDNPNKTQDIGVNHVPPLSDSEFDRMFSEYNSALDQQCSIIRKMTKNLDNPDGNAGNIEEFTSSTQRFQNSFMAFANKTMRKTQFEKLAGAIKKLEPCINESIQKINSMNIGGQTFSLPPIQLPDISSLGVKIE